MEDQFIFGWLPLISNPRKNSHLVSIGLARPTENPTLITNLRKGKATSF